MIINVPLRFPDGQIQNTPLDQIDFLSDGGCWESCERYNFSCWQHLPLKSRLNDEGSYRQDVTLAANYSGIFVQTEYEEHPIEHLDFALLWGLDLLRIDKYDNNGTPWFKDAKLSVHEKTSLGIPTGDRPPFTTAFHYTIDRDEPDGPHPLADSGRTDLDGCLVSYEHPFIERPLPWLGSKELALELGALAPPPKTGKSLFISGNDILAEPISIDPLIGRLIARNCTGQIFGPSGGGKTFVVLDMALCVATGREWAGHLCEQGVVVYLTGEGHTGIRRRVAAWYMRNDEPDISLFYLSKGTIAFDGKGLLEAITECRQLQEACQESVALFVVDTLARHLSGDENSAADMGAFIASVDNLRADFPGSTAIIVHHTGHESEKAGRGRGSSSLKAAMDFEIMCSKKMLEFTKNKDAETPPNIVFKLSSKQIGVDDNGDAITSCVVEYGERSQPQQQNKLTAFERVATQALINVCIANAATHNSHHYASMLNWREEFYRLRTIDDPAAKPESLKKAFARAAGTGSEGGGLKEKGIVSINETGVFPLRNEDHIAIEHGKAGTRDIDGTLTGHVPTVDGTDGTHSYRSVPMSLPASRPDADTAPPF